MAEQPTNESEAFTVDDCVKELSGHPAFMEAAVTAAAAADPNFIAALQALKYDDDEDLVGGARAYKDEGNRHYQLKKYRWAVDSYSAGIDKKCNDRELNSVLYANRAAAHFRLGNYRSSHLDCARALAFKDDHEKAILRGAESLMKLTKYEEVTKWIEKYPLGDQGEGDRHLQELKQQAAKLLKFTQRDERKAVAAQRRDQAIEDDLSAALQARFIQFKKPAAEPLRKFLSVEVPDGSTAQLQLSGGRLVWPVVFVYPEVEQFDVVKEFHEDDKFESHLQEMLIENPPPWLEGRDYSLQFLLITFLNKDGIRTTVNCENTLLEVLARPDFELNAGAPSFCVLSRKSLNFESLWQGLGMKQKTL